MNKDKLILVVGATGKQGGAVLRHLVRAGIKVRALTRDPEKDEAKQLLKQGAEVIAGNLSDRTSLENAATGAYGVFSVQNYWEKGIGFEGEIRQGKNLADAAKKAGVKHFVQSTMAQAMSFRGVEHFKSKLEVEKYIDQIGLPRTFVGMVYFMDNVLDPKLGGSMTFPVLSGTLEPETRFHMIAVDDIGAIVAKIFQQPEKFIGKRFDIAGDLLTVNQMIEVYRRVTGNKPKSWWIPAFIMRMMNKDFARQLQWHNEAGWTFEPEEVRSFYPKLTNFEQFLRQHTVTNL